MLRMLFAGFLLVGLLWAEPSVYSNSGSSSRQVKRNQNAIYKLKQEIARLHEELEGLRSIVAGLNQSVGRLQQGSNTSGADAVQVIEMRRMLDQINRNYVSKAELSRTLKKSHHAQNKPSSKSGKAARKKTAKISVEKPKADKPSGSGNGLESAASAALYSKGVRLVNKKRYSDAKKRFVILEKRGYKKASTHFYLGEIAYRNGEYARAIEQYKQSAELNENAGYMDRLLLHTGISLEKTNDTAQAKRFFQAIVDGYPNTLSAKVARHHL